jgi:HD superfamily phosphohydrolase
MRHLLLSIFFVASLAADLSFELPYGSCQIKDKALEEVISSEAFDRLKQMHQYGIVHYNLSFEPYSRYDHCLGVYMILDTYAPNYLEKVSGLLHDASHTAFSHFGDYFFKSHGEDAWQDLNHNAFLEKIGLAKLLNSHNFKLDEIYHKNKEFSALDQPLPELCADRIDYNLQGAYRLGLLTKQETQELFNDLRFENGIWSLSNVVLTEKMAKAGIYMMETIWSSSINHVSNHVLCDLMDYAVQHNLITLDEVCLKPDESVMKKLQSTEDAYIKKGLQLISVIPNLVKEGHDFQIPYKCRAINPSMRLEDGSLKKLTELSLSYETAFKEAQDKANKGFNFSLDEKDLETYKGYFSRLLETKSSVKTADSKN